MLSIRGCPAHLSEHLTLSKGLQFERTEGLFLFARAMRVKPNPFDPLRKEGIPSGEHHFPQGAWCSLHSLKEIAMSMRSDFHGFPPVGVLLGGSATLARDSIQKTVDCALLRSPGRLTSDSDEVRSTNAVSSRDEVCRDG